jgi:hypothetical protein
MQRAPFLVLGKLLDVARESGLALVFECRQGFQYFTGFGTVENQVVLANSPISKARGGCP